MSEGHITHVRLYEIALSNLMQFADPRFFHAFDTFRTVEHGAEALWSIEKNPYFCFIIFRKFHCYQMAK